LQRARQREPAQRAALRVLQHADPERDANAGTTVDLGDAFVVEPAHIQGDILLKGPPVAAIGESALADMIRISDFDSDGDGIPDGTPFTAPLVTGAGTFAGPDFELQLKSYDVESIYATGTPLKPDTASNGLVVLTLPPGSYLLHPSITVDSSLVQLDPVAVEL